MLVATVIALMLVGFAGSTSAQTLREQKDLRAATHMKTAKEAAAKKLERQISRYQRRIHLEIRATWAWQREGHVTPTRTAKKHSCMESRGLAYLRWCYKLWFKRHHKWQKYAQSLPRDTGYLPPAAARQLGKKMAAFYYGWAGEQWDCLDRLWGTRDGQTLESGWDVTADNPHSDAYGIPQALPGSKMASAGKNWLKSAFVQIKWGLGYIRNHGSFSNPCEALAYRLANGSY